jgi:hypothetical protein
MFYGNPVQLSLKYKPNKTFMKRLLFLAAILFSFQLANAQLKVGLRAGLNSTTTQVNEIVQNSTGIDEYRVSAGKANYGFHFGLMTRVSLLGIYVQPEVLFISTSSQVKIDNLVENTSSLINQDFKKLDIPIMIGLKLGPDAFALRVNAGPIASIKLSGNSVFESVANVQPTEDLKKATWGYQAGVGLDLLDKIGLDVKYEGSLTKLGDGVIIAGHQANFDSRTSQWVFSLAYYF